MFQYIDYNSCWAISKAARRSSVLSRLPDVERNDMNYNQGFSSFVQLLFCLIEPIANDLILH